MTQQSNKNRKMKPVLNLWGESYSSGEHQIKACESSKLKKGDGRENPTTTYCFRSVGKKADHLLISKSGKAAGPSKGGQID